MTYKNYWLFIFWIVFILLASCARRGTPTGGPKDSIPPTLVRMDPALGKVNFDDNELVLEFSEFIEARDLKKELIINPSIKNYNFYANKRILRIDLEAELQDSTTYTFNFREGIKDISEGNSAKNIIMAFSTGSYLDSFQVAGKAHRLLTNKPAKDVVVGLYPVKDTITILNGSPMYFTKTDEEGNYMINYIKEGAYRIYAFDDQNNNLKYESNNEAIGFKSAPITLKPDSVQMMAPLDSIPSDSIPSEKKDSLATELKLYGARVNLGLIKKDVRPINIQSSRANGRYYEIKFNKPLKSFKITTEESDITEKTRQYVKDSIAPALPDSIRDNLFANFQEQHQLIRIYNTLKQDSARIFLTVEDSVNQQIEDTVLYVKFAPTKRKAEPLTQQFKPEQSEIIRSIKAELSFSKPITSIETDSILLAYDTLFTIPLDYSQHFTWNDHYDQVNIQKEINKSGLVDSVIAATKRNDSIAFQERVQLEQKFIDSLKGAEEMDAQLRYLQELVSLQNNPIKTELADSIIHKIEDPQEKLTLLSAFKDTVKVTQEYRPPSLTKESILRSLKPLVLYMAPGSFMSVEQDSSAEVRQNFAFKNPEEYGTIKGEIETEYPSYIIQLLDKESNIIAETRSRNNYTFPLINPGSYKIRILIDLNEDGQWDSGNLLEMREPEPVIFYEQDEINLNANWEVTLDLTF